MTMMVELKSEGCSVFAPTMGSNLILTEPFLDSPSSSTTTPDAPPPHSDTSFALDGVPLVAGLDRTTCLGTVLRNGCSVSDGDLGRRECVHVQLCGRRVRQQRAGGQRRRWLYGISTQVFRRRRQRSIRSVCFLRHPFSQGGLQRWMDGDINCSESRRQHLSRGGDLFLLQRGQPIGSFTWAISVREVDSNNAG